MKKLIVSILCVAALAGCTLFQSQEGQTLFWSGVVSTAMQYAVPANLQHEVALQFDAAANLYDKFAGPNGLPTPEQASEIFKTYLPATPNKDFAVGTIMEIYWTYYPTWVKYSPSKQLEYFHNFLIGGQRGIAPYL